MVAKGNVDKHRTSIAGVGKVTETEKWGRSTARERYGKLDQPDMRPKDMSEPQKLGDQSNLRGPGWKNDHKMDWVRGAKEDGRPPHFDRAYRPKGK